jgi:hypothetical protein
MLPALGVSRKEWIVRNAVQPNAQPTNWLRTLPVVVDKVFRSAVDISFGGLLQVALWLLLQAVLARVICALACGSVEGGGTEVPGPTMHQIWFFVSGFSPVPSAFGMHSVANPCLFPVSQGCS